jgi:hypothetical protein
MKKLALCILTLGIASSAFGSACVSGTLASYINQVSCTVGSYTFNNFLFASVDVLAPGVGAGDIMVDATVGPNGPNVTFTPDSALQAAGLVSAADYILGFEVTSNDPTIGFQAVNLGATGSVTGLSTAAVAEADCYGGLFQIPNPITGIVGLACLNSGVAAGATATLPSGNSVTASVPIEFTGFSTTVDVLKDVTLAAVLGSASVDSITQSFTTENSGSAVPEPTSFFLGGCGLIAIAFVGRRRIKKPSMA